MMMSFLECLCDHAAASFERAIRSHNTINIWTCSDQINHISLTNDQHGQNDAVCDKCNRTEQIDILLVIQQIFVQEQASKCN